MTALDRSAPLAGRAARAASRLRRTWFSHPRQDLLSGLVVALVLIPEALAFSVIAGVDPRVGLDAAMVMAVVTALVGGRPGMISGATGSVALVIGPLARSHGVDFLLAAVVLAGVVQVVLGALGVGSLLRFVPRPVALGFVNALGILLLVAQLPQIVGHGLVGYALVAAGLAITLGLPRLTRVVPAALVAIAALTAVVALTGVRVPDVGDRGRLPTSLPHLLVPHVPLTLHTLEVVLPYSLTMALVGLMESLLTAQIVDSITGTRSDKDVEARGQGIANVVTGLLGGMGGCALIGQSMINMRNGGRTRLSTLASGVFLAVLVLALAPVVRAIPMAALAAVMVVVAGTTFDLGSVRPRAWRARPRSESAIMVVVVALVLVTDNLAIGVVVGSALAALSFARRVAHLVDVDTSMGEDGLLVHRITGALFFASTHEMAHELAGSSSGPAGEAVHRVVVDLSAARLWDSTAARALDDAADRWAARGVAVELVGLDEHSAALRSRLAAVGARA